MRKVFLTRLFLCVFVAFLVTLLASFAIQTRQSWAHSEALIRERIGDAREQVEKNSENLVQLQQSNSVAALTKARVLACMAVDHPAYITSAEELRSLIPVINADELHIIDASGHIVNSSDASLVGYDMAGSEQSGAFAALLGTPGAELVQQPVARGVDQKIMQYAGVVLPDGDVLVQVGYHPERLQESMALADIVNLAPCLRIGSNGLLAVVKGGVVVSDGDRGYIGKPAEELGVSSDGETDGAAHYVKIGGTRYMCVSERFDDCVIVGMLPENEIFTTRQATVDFLVVSTSIVFLTVFALIWLLVQREVINGIYAVNGSLQKITAGDLEERVSVRRNREFCSLSDGINTTVDALKDAIAAAAKRIDEELEFARAIQYGSVPNVFPPYPDRNEFSIYAFMHPAKEVGGDFYDFFIIGGSRLGFVIADVSGKGIGAALFMMSAKTQIKNRMLAGGALDAVMADVNDSLCEENDTGMFVTAFAGVFDFARASFSFVSAGHNPPLLRHGNGAYAYMTAKRGLVLGAMAGVRYTCCEQPLLAGDQLLLYTDGVTEAVNPALELYGEERLAAFVNDAAHRREAPEPLLADLYGEIERYRDIAEQADDITMLSVAVSEVSSSENRIVLPADIAHLDEATGFVEALLTESGVPGKTVKQVLVSVDELFTNVASYAYGDEAGVAALTCTVDEARITVELADCGKPYNPLEKPDPDVTLSTEERDIGGLGIFLAKKLMDDMRYAYENGFNRVTMIKNR